MRIVVCVKYVPDAQSHRRLEGGTLVRGEEDSLNDLDENAIEAALAAKENHGGEVIALTMGPAGAKDAVMRALQMGADRAIQITDDRLAGSDVIGTAQVLAAAITKLGEDAPIDLVLTGSTSLDGMTSMLPGALGATLGWPSLTAAATFAIEDDAVTVSRYLDNFADVLTAPYPLVCSVTDEANQPRTPGFKLMLAAKKKPIEVWDLDALAIDGQPRYGSEAAGTQMLRADKRDERRGEGRIVTDSGTGGVELAQFLREAGFAQGN
ncbi:electron transfer flavoprotein subunit beta/FixA family protein [Nanchangia anserum]|uniref:Electron transfer flavoprotein subunit beta n=1 Tax=Nanchangia anserum TaxID=2692125 RepID=A0A8I0GA11_9ACTO|nr:electron transfer flavoprotein subunit beta/FixA family protein [Nanchangia anserum]MBD3689909.1 electron transfer flavoprotein subunit beta/FixA family protein [Nanchangia anserum]QOX82274.1 electron transfer flavoprotein subunit beta/FixA family protein [Nanchangia anserum]